MLSGTITGLVMILCPLQMRDIWNH